VKCETGAAEITGPANKRVKKPLAIILAVLIPRRSSLRARASINSSCAERNHEILRRSSEPRRSHIFFPRLRWVFPLRETNRGPRCSRSLRPGDNGDSEDSSISRGDFSFPDDSLDSFPSNTPFLAAKSSVTRRALSGVEELNGRPPLSGPVLRRRAGREGRRRGEGE